MIMFDDIQEKVYQELKEVIRERSSSLEDKPNTHYFNAFLEELMRHCPMLQINVPHLTQQDTNFKGHFFPKGTQVFVFHGAIHFNEDHFK